ncbi:uncharacterized protein SPPG_03698 [Spizellomyces punctatus DAOM BR117]|uniref:Peroxisomal biogenesis factor 11 n=1 Tax=Spizellomyces punctatus (strain DAOM BR117) TaxID=645134 RepID=A0A0L0HKC4_SPIPD|nr:uncharacterized protein SPPG_03698 [Spizellomyces punctatus DAOM BR117]KND01911.1 hypothetical protein SPPG_03698 [Spizellomyces punctatus DAOM BR117]|eukprot:XP_016609950.1 hypothetical protein SPPG_03698 [Spizellomyces punctatus DAOM BR117]
MSVNAGYNANGNHVPVVQAPPAELVQRLKAASMLQNPLKDSNSKAPSASSNSIRKSLPRSIRINPLVQVLILRRVLLLTDGRDKVMKVIQYGLKTAMWLHILDAKRHPTLHSHANKTVSQFSMTRKVIRLFYWLNSLDEFVELAKERHFGMSSAVTPTEKLRQFLAVFNAIVGIVNGWADDLVVAGKMGIVDKPLYNRATILADRLWYVSIFIDAHENVHGTAAIRRKLVACRADDESKRKELESKLYMQKVSFAKLMADFVFCTIDVFHLGDKGISDGWQAVSGFLAALLGTYKVWVKHR